MLVGQFFFWISLQSQASLPGDSTSYTSHFWLSSTTWGWFHVVVNLGLLVAAGLFFLSRLAVAPRLYLTRTRILMVGTISAWVIYLIEIANLKPIPYPDLTPLLFTTWQLILLTYSFNVRLHEILPLARDALIGKMGDAILVLDTQGRIIDLNQAAQQLQTHLLQDQPDQPLAGQLLERLFPVTKQWFAGGSAPPAAPLEISVDEGAVARNFELRVSPLKDALGGLAGYLMICQDTTARKHGEDQRQELSARLEQQVRLLDATLATSSDYFLLLDHQGRLLYASPLALDALGLSIDQASGKTWRKLDLPTEAGEMLDEHMASVYETGKKAATELHYFSKKGAKHFNLTISPILDAQGQVSQVICTFHDIRTRRELEGALRASEDRF
jgi:PAS domain S-box-containing protein